MKTSKLKSRQINDDLAAPVRLTPEQLESVAAGNMVFLFVALLLFFCTGNTAKNGL